MNKSLATNLISASIVIAGYLSPAYGDIILSVGLFSLSGAVTNWVAIHMLFERVPFLYGSGIIPLKFEEFKKGIRSLIMGQFFSQENIQRFLENQGQGLSGVDLGSLAAHVPLDKVFEKLKEAVVESPLGAMLEMFGGAEAIEPLRESFKTKISEALRDMGDDATVQKTITQLVAKNLTGDSFAGKIEKIVEARLSELTPERVKIIIQNMIKEHLGWLVIWGGVFGGLIGLIAGLIQNN